MLFQILTSESFFSNKILYFRGPAPAGSRGTLRMNGVGKCKRERERERETRPGCAPESGVTLFFTVAFIP